MVYIKQPSEPLCPVDGAGSWKEITPIRIELLPHRLKVIMKMNFVLICSDALLYGDEWRQTILAK